MPKQSVHSNLNDGGQVDSEFEYIYRYVPEVKVGITDPSDIPSKVGDEYINETTGYIYKSVDIQASGDWKHVLVEDASAALTLANIASGVSGASGVFNDSFYANAVIFLANLPTASAGLSTGQVWNDSGTLKIIV